MTLGEFRRALVAALGRHLPRAKVIIAESRSVTLTCKAELTEDTSVAVYFNALRSCDENDQQAMGDQFSTSRKFYNRTEECMLGQGRIIGFVLIAIALIVLLVAGVWLIYSASHEAGIGGAILGLFIVLVVVVLPLGGGGVYLLAKGRQESAEYAEIAKQKKILNMVLAQGKVTLSEIALELNAPRDRVEDYVRDLVGKNLFSGAINWQDGILYSKQASEMKADRKCPNCGGQVELAGKGVIKCPYCGAEVFLAT